LNLSTIILFVLKFHSAEFRGCTNKICQLVTASLAWERVQTRLEQHKVYPYRGCKAWKNLLWSSCCFQSSARALISLTCFALHWHRLLFPCTRQHWLSFDPCHDMQLHVI